MAHTYARSYALVTLTLSTTTAFVIDDYLTGQTSGAVGIVASVGTTTIDVYEMSGTAFAPTENVDNVAGTRESCTGTAAYGGSTLPSDAAEVLGIDSTITNIFRKVADIAGISGVSNPSSTQNYLALEMTVYFGREGQTAATYTISYEENVRLGYSSSKSQIRCVSTSTYSTTFQSGLHKYKDNDTSIFPPLYVQQGSIIDIRCVTRGGTGINIDLYSVVYFNNSTLKGDGKVNVATLSNNGELRFVNTLYLNWNGFVSNTSSGKMYIQDIYLQSIQQAFIFSQTALTYSDGIYLQNSSGAAIAFAFFASWESSLKNVIQYDSNGVLSTDYLLATGLGNVVLHCVNSDVDVTKFKSLFSGSGTSSKEISLKLTVLDEDGNPLQNAKVNVTNQYAKALFRSTDVLLSANINNSVTTLNFASAHGLVVGDDFRIASEEMTVVTQPSTTQVTVTRGVNNTVAISHNTTQYLAISEIATTDVNGQINYDSSSDKNAVVEKIASFSGSGTVSTLLDSISYTDFILYVTLSGYKDYKAPITISGKDGIDCPVILEPNRFIEKQSG